MTNTAPIFDSHTPAIQDEVSARVQRAARSAASWEVLLRPTTPSRFGARIQSAAQGLKKLDADLAKLKSGSGAKTALPDPEQAALSELRSRRRDLWGAHAAVSNNERIFNQLPRAAVAGAPEEPRVAALASAYLDAVNDSFSPSTFHLFLQTLQAIEPLTFDEMGSLMSFLEFALLESILRDTVAPQRLPRHDSALTLTTRLNSLVAIHNVDWTALVEPLLVIDTWLSKDPAGAYQSMDFESRQRYRRRVAMIARYSDCDEQEIAQAVLNLARLGSEEPLGDPRIQARRAHVGYYLIDQGFPRLARLAGYHPPTSQRLVRLIRAYSEDFYIGGASVLTLLILAAVLFPPLPEFAHLPLLLLLLLCLLPPAMQIAVDLVNQAITALFDPEPLPKLDFAKGIPADCATLVAVPALLLNENQVHELVQNLEVRSLANRDPHLHFSLLTDLPDSVTKPRENDGHPLVELAIRLIDGLNAKYGAQKKGKFLLLHRRRFYNQRQGVWMSWERKRGKLLDLNKLLTGEFDAFPTKAGPIEVLNEIRYILTLDSDTQLPRETAARLIGAIAHPLNQAVIDPKLRIVNMGYGILQPRVGIAVRSTVRSRLAAIFSGQTGFDLYTRATSDSYQDLFGEGIFAGKGIYEVATFHAVLNHRFPRNSLLSHDLIEGAYARAGLVNDVEVIDDYPSHYSAYNRRQHRWIRGDWQIAQWMFTSVPDEAGNLGKNPISAISRWKIFDNLRRSLVDPALVILFAAGWLGLPGGARYWTLTTLCLMTLPATVPFMFSIARAIVNGNPGQIADAFTGLGPAITMVMLRLVLLLHQTMLIVDAVFRSLFRRFVSGERLLEWETAAQAESDPAPRAPVDRYLTAVWLVAMALGAAIFFLGDRRRDLWCAAPILVAWVFSSAASAWLNHSPHRHREFRPTDEEFLRVHALRTWRYFSEFGSERHNFLIPDNVEERALAEAPRVSPTNIGMLLNARQAACEFGFLTIPEFAALTRNTLGTIAHLKKFRGHLYNWYDTETLQPLGDSLFVSSVDSGNFVASLYTLHGGVRELQHRPLLDESLFAGLHTHWRLLSKGKKVAPELQRLKIPDRLGPAKAWIEWLPVAQAALTAVPASWTDKSNLGWLYSAMLHRVEALQTLVRAYLPWMLPEFASLLNLIALPEGAGQTASSIEHATHLCDEILLCIDARSSAGTEPNDLAEPLREALVTAKNNLRALAASLSAIALETEQLADATEFDFLVNRDRRILSIGYNVRTDLMENTCYDLFASEARIATFLAIARGDLDLQSWFKLEREHTRTFKHFVLMSWTGTMFEYLMPALWMRSYPGTLSSRNETAAVAVQRAFARTLRIPWGISESGKAQRDDCGNYGYHAHGVPQMAISPEATAGPVVSPYSTFLALRAEPKQAIENLKRMESAGWVGAYGFYEAADYTGSLRSPELVREWMAHHQGMALLAIANLLCDDAFPRWFHSNPLVQSVEQLLHESPVSVAALKARKSERSAEHGT
jgi:cyclic beta-1,2-glucan synthetase